MPVKLPSIIVTGASGIVGRSFLEAIKDDFLIYAIARRSQKEAGVPEHPNIKWIQVDIGNWLSLRWVMHNIKRQGGADFLYHLASYYDFEYEDNPEYQRTNVNGTRYLLEQARILRVKRFIFASSTAASNFPPPGEKLSEKSPLDADYAYAQSKKECEKMIGEFSKYFPCSIVRFAAVFTDWCEYGVLYMFLSTWFSKSWNARILGGKGESAVPYIHARDLNKLILILLANSKRLPQLDTYVAGPDGSTTHRELFDMATRIFYGKAVKPLFMPKFLALPGVFMRDLLGRLIGKRPFERPWMLKYLDCKLDIDSSYTRKILGWEPAPRFHILRRLLFLIEKMKSSPAEWHRKNTTALKRVATRPNLMIYETMVRLKQKAIDTTLETILAPEQRDQFPSYLKMEKESLKWYVDIVYQLLSASIRNNDRILLLDYVRNLSNIRFSEGVQLSELKNVLLKIGNVVTELLQETAELKGLERYMADNITMTMQLTVDEVEDAYEHFEKKAAFSGEMEMRSIEDRLAKLETFTAPPKTEVNQKIRIIIPIRSARQNSSDRQ